MFFEYVLEEHDQKRIVLRVLNMIFKKSSYTYSFWGFFLWIPIRIFAAPDPDSGKKSPFWFRTKEPGSETQQLVHRP